MRARVVFRVVAALMIATTSSASEAWVYTAWQPFCLPNGIAVAPVTYVGFHSAEEALEMTCWPNRSRQPDGPEQNNAAFDAGFRATLLGPGSWPGNDTVSVALAIPDTTSKAACEWGDSVLVAATVECLKASAGQYAGEQHRRPLRYLRLEIRGPRRFRSLAGVFDVREYRCGPRQSQF